MRHSAHSDLEKGTTGDTSCRSPSDEGSHQAESQVMNAADFTLTAQLLTKATDYNWEFIGENPDVPGCQFSRQRKPDANGVGKYAIWAMSDEEVCAAIEEVLLSASDHIEMIAHRRLSDRAIEFRVRVDELQTHGYRGGSKLEALFKALKSRVSLP
jgi:hypothetical protein